jgi:hypothetical protein
MKKIIIGLTLICCSCIKEQSKDEIVVDGNDYVIRTIVYKKHEYLLFTGTYKGSLCHSESCKCKTFKSE